VFVDESSEAVSAVFVRWVARRSRDCARGRGWALIEGAVRAVIVAVVHVRPQDAFKVASVDDEEPVEAM
jgi:hypothetical protein